MRLRKNLDKPVATLIESNVLALMSGHGGQLIFAVHIREDAAPDEDLPSGQTHRALEGRARIEKKTIGKFALCVSSNPVAHGLQVFVDFRRLGSGPHPLLLRKFFRQD